MGYLQCSYPRTLFRIASSRRYAQIPARKHILAHICAIKQSRTKSFSTNIGKPHYVWFKALHRGSSIFLKLTKTNCVGILYNLVYVIVLVGKARLCHFGPYGERSGAEQNPLVRNLVLPYRMSPASFSLCG